MEKYVVLYCKENEVIVKRKHDKSLQVFYIDKILELQVKGQCDIINIEEIENYIADKL